MFGRWCLVSIGSRVCRGANTGLVAHVFVCIVVFVASLGIGSAAWAQAPTNGCKVSGQNIFCDTCAAANSAPLADRSISLSGNVTNGNFTGSQNSFCEIVNLGPNETLDLTVTDNNSGGTYTVDFDGQIPSTTITPSSASQSVAPNGSITQSFSSGAAGTTKTRANANIRQTQPTNLNFSVSATLTCGCTAPPLSGNAKVTILKKTVGGNGDVFAFTSNEPSLANPSVSVAANTTGTVSSASFTTPKTNIIVTETDVGSYTGGTTASCVVTGTTDPFTNIGYVPGTRQLTINELASGDDVTCTFTNTASGDIPDPEVILRKVTTDGSTGSFAFTSAQVAAFNTTLTTNGGSDQTTPQTIASGSLISITETDPAPNYELLNASCSGGSFTDLNFNAGSRTLQIKPTTGTITCTFTNRNLKPTDPRMEEETKRFIHRRVDNLLTHGPDRARLLRRLQEDQPPSMKDTGSIKDGPLKFSSTGISAAGPQRGTMMMVGSNAFGQPSNGTNPYFANEDAPRDVTNPNGDALRGNTFFDTIAGQASQLGMAQSGFKFGTSLSQLREMAAEHEEAKQRSKLAKAGLSFAGQHMANPFVVPRTGFDIWMEGHISRYSDDVGGVNRDGDFRILYVGADYVLAPGILIGALVQIDDTTEDIKNNPLVSGERGKIDGTGWMAGPYIGVRLTDKLFFDARAAWGTSNNDIYLKDDVNGPRSGSFDTTRWLTTATLTGNERYGPWRISPQIGLAYGHEEYDTYWNSLNQIVKGGDASIGRFTGAIEVGYQFRTAYGTTIEPHVSITGIYNFDTDDLVINGVMVQSDESRAKVEGGVIIMTPRGWGLRAAGNFDGIGGDDFRSYGGSLWLNIPLN